MQRRGPSASESAGPGAAWGRLRSGSPGGGCAPGFEPSSTCYFGERARRGRVRNCAGNPLEAHRVLRIYLRKFGRGSSCHRSPYPEHHPLSPSIGIACATADCNVLRFRCAARMLPSSAQWPAALSNSDRASEARAPLRRRFGAESTGSLKDLLAAAPLDGIDGPDPHGRLYALFTPRPRNSHRSFARHPATPMGRTRDVRTRPSALGRTMIDLLLLALGVGVGGLLAAYVVGCERV